MTTPPTDFDSPWKAILEQYLPEFFAFFFPTAAGAIDWARGYTFLDKELQQVVRDAALGRRLADKLVQVWRSDGAEAWVLVHIEVQSQEEADFARRMFTYYYRLLDRYHRQVVSVAVLGDERAGWRPSAFSSALWGCAVQFTFPIVKLLDYEGQQETLASNANPFATVVLAHLAAQATRQDPLARGRAKLHLTRRLYGLGYEREAIINLFHFIDWLLRLPEALEASYWEELQQFEEAQQMSYISSVERIGIQKGREEGLREGLLAGIALALELRFGERGTALVPALEQLSEPTQLHVVYDALRRGAALEEIEQLLLTPPQP